MWHFFKHDNRSTVFLVSHSPSLSLSIAIYLQSPYLYHCSCTEVQSNDIISQQHTNNNSIIAEDFYEITNDEYVARSAPNRKFVPRNEKHLFSYHIITRACNHILWSLSSMSLWAKLSAMWEWALARRVCLAFPCSLTFAFANSIFACAPVRAPIRSSIEMENRDKCI